MKNIYKNIAQTTTAILFALAVASALLSPVMAAGETMYMGRSTSTVYKDDQVQIYLRMNSGTTDINAVAANFTYPTSQLQFVSISPGSAFEIQAENSGGSGSVRIGRGTLSPKSGVQLIATITFKALVNSGSATLNYSGDSQIANGGSEVSSSKSGTTINFAQEPAPAPEPEPEPVTSSSPSSNSTTTTTTTTTSNSAPSPDPTVSALTQTDQEPEAEDQGPVISNLDVSFKDNAPVVSWETNKPTSAKLTYGSTPAFGFKAERKSLKKTYSIELESQFFAAKTTYYYQITATDGEGNESQSDVMSFITPGIEFLVTVTDDNGNIVQGALVTYDGETFESDANGQVVLSAREGNQTVVVEYGGESYVLNVNVSNDAEQSQSKPEYAVQVASGSWLNWSTPTFLLTLPLGALLLLLGNVTYKNWNKRQVLKAYHDRVEPGSLISDIAEALHVKKPVVKKK